MILVYLVIFTFTETFTLLLKAKKIETGCN